MRLLSKKTKYSTVIRYFFLATVCMLLIPLYSYGDTKNGEQPDVSAMPVHKKQLKTIIVDNYYPYTFVNQNGVPDGFSVDLIRAVAQEMGLELKIHVDTWDLARNALKDGNIDVLPMMAYSKERDRQFDFSVPHTIAYDAFFTRKAASKIRSLDDLRGKKIIVMKGDQAHDYLLSTRLIGPEQLILIDTLPDALRLLSSGRGDAALMPKLVGLIVAKNLKLSNLELSPIVIEAYNRPFSFAVPEGNLPLLERLSQGLSIVKTSDQYSNIYKKWFGALEPPGLSLRTVLKYIGGIILAFILIGSVLLLWSFSLRRQVTLRTRSLGEEIAERKQAEETLRQSEKRYRELADSLPQVVFETDERGKLLFVNRNAFDIFGYSQHDFDRGINTIEMLIPEDRNRAMENIQRVMRGEGSGGNEYTALRKDGSTFPISIHSNALIRENKLMGMRGIIIDLSQRKEAEEALQQSQARYRSLVENTMDGYFVCEIPSGRFLFLNQRSCDLHGYTMKEGLELTVWDVMSPEDHGHIRERIQARLEHKALSSERQTYTAVRKDGSTFRVEISTSLVTFQGIPGVQGVIRDVTEHERLEQQLQQAHKMEAIGTLAGGIAHDFNNLLMGIQGRASLMLMSKDSSHADFEHLRGIEDYVKSAADLTRQLLGFARGGKYEVKPTDLNDLLKKSSEMFGRTKKEITIHPKYQDDLWAVEADPGQIEQVLLNLYVNAWQAMPGGGELYLETQNMMIDEHYSKPYTVEPGKYVKISITDTGAGMDEATRKRIFDPFFTTKEMGRGTGLGLASVYGIIKSHGGFIDVYSEKGHGTTFKIHLPAMEAKSMAQRAEPDKGLKMARGTETILLVDDEDMIIDVGTELLREMGYHVLIARSGREAIEIVSEAYREEPISSAPDLVILDMIMPHMGGGETYDRLKEINPGIRVLLSSGYSIDGQATEILDRGCNGFIQKPFNIEELSQKLREILDKR